MKIQMLRSSRTVSGRGWTWEVRSIASPQENPALAVAITTHAYASMVASNVNPVHVHSGVDFIVTDNDVSTVYYAYGSMIVSEANAPYAAIVTEVLRNLVRQYRKAIRTTRLASQQMLVNKP